MAHSLAHEYTMRRHERTSRDIQNCQGDKQALLALLEDRKRLAEIYRNDGADFTAECIETTDIALLETALQDIP